MTLSSIQTIGAQVKAERERLGFTQVKLAKLADVTQQTIAAIEMNYDVTLSRVQAVANALGASAGTPLRFDAGAPLPTQRPWTKKTKA